MKDLTEEQKKEISEKFSDIITKSANTDDTAITQLFDEIIASYPQKIGELGILLQKELENNVINQQKSDELKGQFSWRSLKYTLLKAYSGTGVTLKLSSEEPHLEQLATGYQTASNGKKYEMTQYTYEELKDHELKYNAMTGNLEEFVGKSIASTENANSKDVKGAKAYVFQNTSLYVGDHTGFFNNNGPSFTHAALSGGKRVDLAGLIKIKDGKITYIDADSGHYLPNILEFIKVEEAAKNNA